LFGTVWQLQVEVLQEQVDLLVLQLDFGLELSQLVFFFVLGDVRDHRVQEDPLVGDSEEPCDVVYVGVELLDLADCGYRVLCGNQFGLLLSL
jgi:hypothetical protein